MSKGFSAEAIQEAKHAMLDEALFAGRRQVPGITIDGSESRDLDDAIWVERGNDGGYTVTVSIADVAALVPAGSALDKEAYERCFTRYRSWGNHPMLPRELSEDKLSLLEGALRPTVTATIHLDKDLNICDTHLERTKLCSKKRYDHAQAAEVMRDHAQPMREWGELAYRLLEKRRQHGALAFYDVKSGTYTSGEGRVKKVNPDELSAYILVQEMMILANTAVAQKMAREGNPFFFRNHSVTLQAGERSDIVHRIQDAMHCKASAAAAQQTVQFFFNNANYAATNKGHFGLSLDAYTHFTSPIRRYADLVAHRVISAGLEGKGAYSESELNAMGQHIDTVTQAAEVEKKQMYQDRLWEKIRSWLPTADCKAILKLSGSNFSALLHYAIEQNAMTATLAEAISVKLRSGVAMEDLHRIVIDTADRGGEYWPSLRNEALVYMQSFPQNAALLLYYAQQTGSLESPHYETRKLKKSAGFATQVVADINGETLSTRSIGIGTSKQKSEQAAALQFWQSYLDNALVAPKKTVWPAASRITASKNPVSELVELKQRHHFFVEETWPPSGPGMAAFAACLTIKHPILNDPITVTAQASSKKEAKTKATEQLLKLPAFQAFCQAVTSYVPVPVMAPPAKPQQKNASVLLLELVESKHWDMKEEYVPSGSQPNLTFTARLTIAGGKIYDAIQVSGQGKSKAEAKLAAAKNALEHPIIARYHQFKIEDPKSQSLRV